MPDAKRKSDPVAPGLLDQLKSVVGPSGYLEGTADTDPYCVSWRDGWQGATPIVLRPKTTEEVSQIVKLCAEAGVAIVPQGGNTGLTGGGQPHDDMSEVVLTTARMNEVKEIDLENDTVTVEAGVILQKIQELARDNDRLFPLSLGAEGTCQIGGNLATNAGGTQVLRYGNARALVLGLEVVLPNGEVWNGLRGLRKDNTGYDMKHLFIGGEGTLGIITGAVLRLFPKPTATETAWLAVPSPQHAVKLLGHMKSRLGDQVSGFELMQRSIIDFLLSGVPGHEDPLESPHPWYVLAEMTGQGAPDSLSEPFTEALGEAMELGLVEDAVIATSGVQSAGFWKMREDLAEGQKQAAVSIKHDVSVPVSRIAEFLERADAAITEVYPGMRPCAFGHVGDGNLHYNPAGPEAWDGNFYDERETVNRIVHDLVIELGGSISAEHGIGRLRLEENLHYKSPVEIEMMRTLKRALDPKGIMNPGKLITF
ncbi:MAG: FAD-binding oxidoreductase [Alphaproteobacteria bacterium]|nr:FAD-binding oxidoreductase [Alphaproteobacteria bacterium]